jgi:hypothetical protein
MAIPPAAAAAAPPTFVAATPTALDFLTWGKLVMSWATGVNYTAGQNVPTLPAATGYNDPTAIRIALAVPGHFRPAAGIGIDFPDTVTEVVVVRDTAARRYIRLPQAEMVIAAHDGLSNGALNYTLPSFYRQPPLNCSDPNTASVADKLKLQADRVGDYSIGSCA